MADNRVTIPVKLSPGRHDDLIQWWKGLASGTGGKRGGKNTTMIAILRAALFDEPMPAQDDPPPAVQPDGELVQENKRLKAMLEQHERDLHALHSRLEALEKRPMSLEEEPTFESTERMTTEQVSGRKKKLLNAEW